MELPEGIAPTVKHLIKDILPKKLEYPQPEPDAELDKRFRSWGGLDVKVCNWQAIALTAIQTFAECSKPKLKKDLADMVVENEALTLQVAMLTDALDVAARQISNLKKDLEDATREE